MSRTLWYSATRELSYSWSKINFILDLSFLSEAFDSKLIIGFRSQYVFLYFCHTTREKMANKHAICLSDGCFHDDSMMIH